MMKLPRRQFLHLAAGAAALPAVIAHREGASLSDAAGADRSSALLPAAGTDIIARLMGQWLAERLGQPFVIENRPGPVAISRPRRSCVRQPDGYTLLAVDAGQRNQRDALRQAQFQFHPRHRSGRRHHADAHVMVVHPSVPAKTVPEFIAYAKANPGKINMASAGNGSGTHLSGELFKDDGRGRYDPCALSRCSTRTYRSARWSSAGYFGSLPATIEHIRAGKLRALAVTTVNTLGRIAGHPDCERFRTGLRGEPVVRRWVTQEDVHRDRRHAEQGN